MFGVICRLNIHKPPVYPDFKSGFCVCIQQCDEFAILLCTVGIFQLNQADLVSVVFFNLLRYRDLAKHQKTGQQNIDPCDGLHIF